MTQQKKTYKSVFILVNIVLYVDIMKTLSARAFYLFGGTVSSKCLDNKELYIFLMLQRFSGQKCNNDK